MSFRRCECAHYGGFQFKLWPFAEGGRGITEVSLRVTRTPVGCDEAIALPGLNHWGCRRDQVFAFARRKRRGRPLIRPGESFWRLAATHFADDKRAAEPDAAIGRKAGPVARRQP